MDSMPVAVSGFEENPPRVNPLYRILKVMMARKLPAIGLAIILITIIVAIFAPWIAPYDPYQPDLDDILSQPTWKHLLGTDIMGRDTLSRIIYGSRTSLLIGVTAIGVAAVLGMSLGLLAGYFKGITNTIIMRFIDALMAFPMILLALAIAATLGGGLRNIIMALGISLMSVYARLMCGQVLSVKQNDYIMAVKSMGARNSRIMLYHILPNCFPPLIVLVTLMLGTAILAEAGLSFLGVGIEPPKAAWGAMVNNGYQYLLTRPILSFAPGLTIMLVVFAFNMVGDGLRDALDPRLRGTL